MQSSLPKNLWSFVWHFLKSYKIFVIFYILMATLAGFWGPFNSLLIKNIINSLSTYESISHLALLAALLVLNFLIFDNVTWRSITYLNYRFQPAIKNKIVSETFNFVLNSSHQFFQDHFSGQIASRITSLADNSERIIHNLTQNFLRCTSMLIFAFFSMYYVNSIFFLTLAVWFIAFSSYSIYKSKQLVNLADAHAATEAILSGQLVDGITNSSNIRIFARRTYEILRLNKTLHLTNKTFKNQEIFLLKLHAMQGFLIAIMMGFMLYFLLKLYSNQLITIGDFALIIGLSMEVGHISWYTMSEVDEFNKAVGKCKQSLDYLLVPREIKDKEKPLKLSVKQGEITFAKVKFHYKGTRPLFQDKSVTIKPGQKVGLVGYSGSGKSTFVNLILRLYDVTDGAILIDNQDIREVSQDSLHEAIAMIPQEPSLFHRSLMENIGYGQANYTEKQVIKAAKKAHADEFITKLPEGYESLVGERGIKLSGGQRQRVAIARAILKNAPILILDEATSQLDSVTEQLIQESLWELMQGKTTLVIAHRLSTLLHMDRILVFDQGKIVEDGPHTELIKKQGLYKTLWDAQIGGFLPDKKTPSI